jgi:hypothetical protein
MKQLNFIALALTGAGLMTGCDSRSPVAADDAEVVAAPQFSANKGLLLPDVTRQSLGLKIVEVTERKLSSPLDFQLRVYQVAGGVARASGVVTPDEAKLLKAGQAIQVRLNDGQTLPGKVTSVSDQLQRATGSAEALVEIPNAPDGLAVGAFVPATVTMETGADVVTIPRAALLGCSEGHFVYTVSGEHLVRTAVKVGANNAEFVEIADGLYTGDQVVSQPVMSLWLTELAAVKGGQACCIEPPKGK